MEAEVDLIQIAEEVADTVDAAVLCLKVTAEAENLVEVGPAEEVPE